MWSKFKNHFGKLMYPKKSLGRTFSNIGKNLPHFITKTTERVAAWYYQLQFQKLEKYGKWEKVKRYLYRNSLLFFLVAVLMVGIIRFLPIEEVSIEGSNAVTTIWYPGRISRGESILIHASLLNVSNHPITTTISITYDYDYNASREMAIPSVGTSNSIEYLSIKPGERRTEKITLQTSYKHHQETLNLSATITESTGATSTSRPFEIFVENTGIPVSNNNFTLANLVNWVGIFSILTAVFGTFVTLQKILESLKPSSEVRPEQTKNKEG